MKEMILKVLLCARGASSLAFGAALAGWIPTDLAPSLTLAGAYAAADGLLGLAVGFILLLMPLGRSLSVLTVIDAMARVLLGSIILNASGLAQTVFGDTLFFTMAIFFCMIVGVGSFAYLCFLRIYSTGSNCPLDMQFWTGVALAVFTIVLGVGFAVDVTESRRISDLSVYALAMGVLFVVSAIRLHTAASNRIASA